MNEAQKLWWEQAKSDHAAFICLRRAGVHECHMLHYLQMAAEKISKAYLWRSGSSPPRSHVGLMRFMRALLGRGRAELSRVAKVFEFGRPRDIDAWVRILRRPKRTTVRTLSTLGPTSGTTHRLGRSRQAHDCGPAARPAMLALIRFMEAWPWPAFRRQSRPRPPPLVRRPSPPRERGACCAGGATGWPLTK
jgi:hypothetical protein